MPYIKANDGRREALRRGEKALLAGELNYQIFYYVKNWKEDNDEYSPKLIILSYVQNFLGEKPNYQRYNDMTGALILCAKEIERRLNIDVKRMFKGIVDSYDKQIAIYEDLKINENGDVE